MKSILVGPEEKKKEEIQYPYMGICRNKGYIILFTSKDTGTLMHDPTGYYTVGNHATNWAEGVCFDRLKGKVILSN